MLTSKFTFHMLKCIVRGHVCSPLIHDSSFIHSFIHSFIQSVVFFINNNIQLSLFSLLHVHVHTHQAVILFLNRYPQHVVLVLCCIDREQNPILLQQLFTVDTCHSSYASSYVSTKVQVSSGIDERLI